MMVCMYGGSVWWVCVIMVHVGVYVCTVTGRDINLRGG